MGGSRFFRFHPLRNLGPEIRNSALAPIWTEEWSGTGAGMVFRFAKFENLTKRKVTFLPFVLPRALGPNPDLCLVFAHGRKFVFAGLD